MGMLIANVSDLVIAFPQTHPSFRTRLLRSVRPRTQNLSSPQQEDRKGTCFSTFLLIARYRVLTFRLGARVQSKGYAFVLFRHKEVAQVVADTMNGTRPSISLLPPHTTSTAACAYDA